MERYRLADFVGHDQSCHVAASILPVPGPRTHTHDFFEVFWVRRGAAEHRLNGSSYDLRPGTLVLIRPSDRHGFSTATGEGLWIVNIAFSRSVWLALRRRYSIGQADPFLAADAQRHLALSPAAMAALEQAAEDLIGGARRLMAVDRFLLNLLRVLDRQGARELPADMPAWLAAACREVQRPHHLRRGAAALVELAGRSPEHVCRAARRFTGRTPTELVNEARLTLAATQLEQTRQSIADIAADCGLPNLSHFYRLFQERFGLPPRAYRQRQQTILGRGPQSRRAIKTSPPQHPARAS